MTPLEELLIWKISCTGPITVADYMIACLLHPRYGYFTSGQTLGSERDFVTAPEISHLIG